MKTIQLTTVRKMANIQVIEVNSKFIVKAFKALESFKFISSLLDASVDKKFLNEEDAALRKEIVMQGASVGDFLGELIDALEEGVYNDDNKQEGE